MASHLGNLLIVVSTMVATLLVETVANPPYTYTEGFYNAADQLFANCTYNVKGTWGAVKVGDIPVKTDTNGAKITYINIQNNKPSDQQGTITKTDGGTGFSYVDFHIVSVESHGFLFQIEIRGTTPPGTTEKPLTGSCLG